MIGISNRLGSVGQGEVKKSGNWDQLLARASSKNLEASLQSLVRKWSKVHGEQDTGEGKSKSPFGEEQELGAAAEPSAKGTHASEDPVVVTVRALSGQSDATDDAETCEEKSESN